MASKRTLRAKARELCNELNNIDAEVFGLKLRIKDAADKLVKLGAMRGLVEGRMILLGIPECGEPGCDISEPHGHQSAQRKRKYIRQKKERLIRGVK